MSEVIGAWLGGFSLGLIAVVLWLIARTSTGVNRVERKIDALLKHSGMDLAQVALQEAQTLMKAGRKIEAIRVYRELTGASLAEAKAAVERLE